MKYKVNLKVLILGFCLVLSTQARAAASGGGFSLGLNMGIATSSQTDLNNLIKNANSRATGLSVGTIGNAWEFSGMFTYRASSLVALQFRPSFFYQSEEGTANNGDAYAYSAVGWTVFPVLKLYLLENQFIKFFSNFSVGWGMVTGEVQEGANKLKFTGNNLGYMLGLGAEFCFVPSHCLNIEGNVRFLKMERVKASSASGTWDGTGDTIDQGVDGQEVEVAGSDLALSMSGVVAQIGYIFYF